MSALNRTRRSVNDEKKYAHKWAGVGEGRGGADRLTESGGKKRLIQLSETSCSLFFWHLEEGLQRDQDQGLLELNIVRDQYPTVVRSPRPTKALLRRVVLFNINFSPSILTAESRNYTIKSLEVQHCNQNCSCFTLLCPGFGL